VIAPLEVAAIAADTERRYGGKIRSLAGYLNGYPNDVDFFDGDGKNWRNAIVFIHSARGVYYVHFCTLPPTAVRKFPTLREAVERCYAIAGEHVRGG